MPQIKRRHFLQLAGSTLASIGLSQLDLIHQGDRYGRVLAQRTPRKLALLVGINNYSDDIGKLRGCLTDVELQYELLVHRFGFQPADIMIISDPIEGLLADRVTASPTRDNILRAFEEHLINQTREGDVVVFHYSGHGSLVKDDNVIAGFNNRNGTMVPIDGRSNLLSGSGQVNDIMGKTLFLLTYALKTENVSVVLDSCHSGGGTRGNLVFRSISGRSLDRDADPSEAELAYQDVWRERTQLSPQQLQDLRKEGIAKGMALGSARISQLAADAPFGDFHAGAFTYLLTRYLWQQVGNQSLDTIFINLSRSTHDVAKIAGIEQDPIHEVKPNSNYGQHPPYFLEPQQPAAEAVVREFNGDRLTFWLGGVSSQSLEAFTEGAVFNLIDAQGNPIGEVTQTGRSGLEGYGTLSSPSRSDLNSGILMREQIRGIPTELSLRVGLDTSLAADMEAARSALVLVSRVTPITLDQTQPVDYLLGRLTETSKTQATEQGISVSAPVGSIGLFTPGLTPVPDSFDRSDESVEGAVRRLQPRMKMLLAGRILKAVVNSETSDVNVDVKVTPVETGGLLLSRGSRATQEAGIIAQTIDVGIQQIKLGTKIQIEVTNHEFNDLHIGILVIASNGDLVVLHPVDWDAAEIDTLVQSSQTVTVPKPGGDFEFVVGGPAGYFELLVLVSTDQLRDALRGLKEVARGRGIRAGNPLVFGEGQTRGSNEREDAPVQVLDNLLGDLNRSAQSTVYTRGRRSSDTRGLAAFSAIFEVAE
ncbi:MAG: caspase family protein [Cyanobacteria bacterium P01_D01_bin.156]